MKHSKIRYKFVCNIKFSNSTKHSNESVYVEFQIFAGSLTTVIGAVGAGKSTLLHMVLNELPCTSGYMQINGTVSYASQDPWLFVGMFIHDNDLYKRDMLLLDVEGHHLNFYRVCPTKYSIRTIIPKATLYGGV